MVLRQTKNNLVFHELIRKGLIDFATVSRLRLYCVLRDLRTLTHDMNDRFVLLVAQATK